MKVKELIEKLKEFDGEADVVIRFAVSSTDDIGYVLIPKIIDKYISSDTVTIYANYEHTAEDCDFMGQVDLKQAYENERRQNEVIDTNTSSIGEYIKILDNFSKENVIYGSTVGMTLEKYKNLQLSAKHILSDYKSLQEDFCSVDCECIRLEHKEVELEKAIDLMAEFFNKRSWREHQVKDDTCNCCKVEYGADDCKDCLKQYFKNKAKEVKQ